MSKNDYIFTHAC